LILDEFLELFHARQFAQVFQSEVDKELSCRLVKDGTAEDFFAARGGDELLIEKGFDDACSLNAANLVDLRNRGRLFVGDDGEGFEGRQGEPGRRNLALDEVFQNLVMFRLGRKSIPIRNFTNLDTPVGYAIVFDQVVEPLFQFRALDIRQSLLDRIKA